VLHAGCRAHLLCDLKYSYDFAVGKQDWAEKTATLLVEARDAARDARQAGSATLDPQTLGSLTSRYRALAAAGLAANVYWRTVTGRAPAGS
jgi:hypothetical protein